MEYLKLPNGRKFYYDYEYLSYTNIQPMLEEDGIKLLHITKQLFDSKEIVFFLAYGTLLGAIREKKIIKGDEDLDICVISETDLLNNLEYLSAHGLKLVRFKEHCTYSFKYGGNSYIDVYIMRPLKWYSLWANSCYSLANNSYTPKSLFQGFEEISFYGMQFKCPKNPNNLLSFWYGDTWRTPIKGHRYMQEVSSHYYYKHFGFILKAILLTLILWPVLRTLKKGYFYHDLKKSIVNWMLYLRMTFDIII